MRRLLCSTIPFLVLCGCLDVRASMPNTPLRCLCFGLRCEERVLAPATVLRARARVHDAPARADHLEGQVTRRAEARPPPATAGEERERDDAPVLVALEELALDPPAVDVFLEPRERLVGVCLRRLPEMRALGSVDPRHADVDRVSG